MGESNVRQSADNQQVREFMRALLADIRALEQMLEKGLIETGIRRVGAEQEMFLVDKDGRPAKLASQMLEHLNHPAFTNELAQFNLEANLEPHAYGGSCLSDIEHELHDLMGRAREAAHKENGAVVLTGILPTLRKANLGLDSMTQNPRYFALNDAIMALRDGELHLRMKGVDEIDITHDNVMLESCNTSFQIHFQTGPEEFAKLYNLAQVITAPVLAPAVNSPILLGKRLWHETRVALFQQSVDARSQSHQARGLRPRVSFGNDWVKDSVIEIFQEDIARFRVLLSTDLDEDPAAVLARGEIPELSALKLHNGTVYRWNRACYGVCDGIAHIRIENRVLPAGPTVIDEVSNAAFYFGLMSALGDEYGDPTKVISFDDAKANFNAAARHGLKAQFTWAYGREISASALILEHLLPLARQGLTHAKIDSSDIDRYLGTIEDRVHAGQTGSQWALDSLSRMDEAAPNDQRLRSLTNAAIARQSEGSPVHTWSLADISESDGWRSSYLKVGQFMTTDLFTVRPGDVVDLAASLMDWRHIRHVPVEDNDGSLVGLVSHRSLLRLVGQGLRSGESQDVAVEEIMKADPVTVSPETPTLDAIQLMRKHRVGCLPVVENGKLAGIITERDLVKVAASLFEKYLEDHNEV